MGTGHRRREAILTIIAQRQVHTQDELVAALAERGYRASQASVSRDIAALRLAKANGRYVQADAPLDTDNPHLARIRDGLLGVRRAGDHLIVLSTPPGEASAVAVALDSAGFAGVVGSVAGDDTILVAVETGAHARDLARFLQTVAKGRAPR